MLADPNRLARPAAGASSLAEPPRQLEQRQRVPTRQRMKSRRRLVAGHAVQGEKLARGLARQAREVDLLECRRGRSPALADPRRDNHRDPLGLEPADGKAERLRRLRIQPMGVVERHEERRLLRRGCEQAECRRSDSQPVRGRADVERERCPERRRLPAGELVDPREQRPRHLEQPPERHLGLRLHALRPNDEHARARSTA